jgi:hypothetical protein
MKLNSLEIKFCYALKKTLSLAINSVYNSCPKLLHRIIGNKIIVLLDFLIL